MRLLVLGHNGMLGSDVMKLYDGHDLLGLSVEDVDITDFTDIQEKFTKIAPDVVINCAAYTDVDGCETNTGVAFAVNGDGVRNIARLCGAGGARLIHISTDYVFPGNKQSPYKEDDETAPISAYGRSKLAGEEHIKELIDDYAILRTQWLFGKNGKNFVTTMLRLAGERDKLTVVDDQVGSPTYTKDLAVAIKAVIDSGSKGIYHVSNSGNTSWYGFALKIFEYANIDVQVDAMTSDQLTRAAKRPMYSVFDLSKLKQDTGMEMPVWEDALKRYLNETGVV